MIVRPVADDQWGIVAWLWQDFRHDLGVIVNGFPYADGRYKHAWLDEYPRPDGAGYLVWQPHPNTGEDAPVAFATCAASGPAHARCRRSSSSRRRGEAAWVGLRARRDRPAPGRVGGPVPAGQRAGGGVLARRRHRGVGDAWTETAEPVPGKPDVPPDHWIRTG